MKQKTLKFMTPLAKEYVEPGPFAKDFEHLLSDITITKDEFKKAKKKIDDLDVFDEIPAFYELHIELVPYIGDGEKKEWENYLNLTKSEKGISRDIIVSEVFDLMSLHYCIQKLFGFRNSHLHRFTLEDKDFETLTAGSVKKFLELAGTVFVFPNEDFADKYYDDDYNGGNPDKWLRKKYSKIRDSYSISETYIDSLEKIEKYLEYYKKKNGRELLDTDKLKDEHGLIGYSGGVAGDLLERLVMSDIFRTNPRRPFDVREWKAIETAYIDECNGEIKRIQSTDPDEIPYILNAFKDIRALRNNIESIRTDMSYGQSENVKNFFKDEPKNVIKRCQKLIKEYFKEIYAICDSYNPMVEPFTKSIIYHYDEGDGNQFKITVKECYYFNDFNELVNSKGERDIELEERIMAQEDIMPICTNVDGVNMFDDCGGIGGLLELLELMNGPDSLEKRSKEIWAKGQGFENVVPNKDEIL